MFANSNKILNGAMIIALLFILSSCTNSKQTTINTSETIDNDSLAVYLERGVCFGRCPVYSISIFRSGYVIYEGKANVVNIGSFSAQLDEKILDRIFNKADETGYWSLEKEYINPHLTDFPTIRSTINNGNNKNQVTRFTESPPKNLLEIEEYIDSFFESGVEWKSLNTNNSESGQD